MGKRRRGGGRGVPELTTGFKGCWLVGWGGERGGKNKSEVKGVSANAEFRQL